MRDYLEEPYVTVHDCLLVQAHPAGAAVRQTAGFDPAVKRERWATA